MTLPTLYYREGYKYVVHDDYLIKLPFAPPEDIITEFISFFRSGLLLVKRNYPWDGASGPTIDTKNTMIASLVHDALYELFRLEVLSAVEFRDDADAVLEQLAMEATPGWRKPIEWARFKAWYLGVRGFAGNAALKEGEPPVLTAP